MTLPITPPGKSRIIRLPYWEPFDGLVGGSTGFLLTTGVTQLAHARFAGPIKFSKVHVYISTTEGGATIQATLWRQTSGGVDRLLNSGAVAVGGSGTIQALDLGSMFSPGMGADYEFGFRVVTAGTLRLHTANNPVAIAQQIKEFSPIGRVRQKSASAAGDTSYATADLAASLSHPPIYFYVVNGV